MKNVFSLLSVALVVALGASCANAGDAVTPAQGAGAGVSSASLDAVFGSARGDILYRGASGWAVLAPGTSGYALVTNGAGADPAWASIGVTFPLLAPDGSAGAPSYSFANATGVGVYKADAASVGISGRVLQGSASPWSASSGLLANFYSTAAGASISLQEASATATPGPIIGTVRSRGTDTAPTNVLSGDQTGGFWFGGRTDTTWNFPSRIDSFAVEDWAGVSGADLRFSTTAAGSGSPTEQWRLTSGGNWIGKTGAVIGWTSGVAGATADTSLNRFGGVAGHVGIGAGGPNDASGTLYASGHISDSNQSLALAANLGAGCSLSLNGTLATGIGVKGDLYSSTDTTYSLGTTNFRWGNLYLSGSANGITVASFAVHASSTGTTSIDATATVWPCDTTSAGFTITLPTAVGVSGRVYVIKKTVAANTLTIATGGGNIDGNATISVSTQNQSYTLVSDGTNWLVE
jgi:hypothetical protein